MTEKLRYNGGVQRLNRAMVAAFAVAALSWAVPASWAQINGAPPSVSSPGFGGNPGSIHGTAPSVTSLGPRGYTSGRGPNPGLFGTNRNLSINGHHRHNGSYYPWGGYYAVPSYGYYDPNYDADDQADDQDQYNGGPTIFDRRGPGTAVPRPPIDSYANNGPRENAQPGPDPEQSQASPASDQAQTVLVFKDGHQLEVENYAIIGNTLYDLTEGHRRKIALSELDLDATAKENDDRGIDFELPSEAN